VTALVWDDSGNRKFETGIDQGVLYILNTVNGLYDTGYAWNGLTGVKEKPAGAASNKQYADNIAYLNLLSAETFGGEIDAFTYPDAFAACDGTSTPQTGVTIGQQNRSTFGLSYRTRLGNDLTELAGYKYHLVYGAVASPSEKDYSTVNDNPAAVSFSWAFECTPATVTSYSPTCLIEVDSTKVDSTALTNLLNDLYGTGGTSPLLPTPDAVLALFSGTVTMVTLTAPTFDGAHTITIPSQTGVKYYVDGVLHAAGTQVLTSGQKKIVTAVAQSGYAFNTPVVTSWLFSFVS
jgi:hypothetical protein